MVRLTISRTAAEANRIWGGVHVLKWGVYMHQKGVYTYPFPTLRPNSQFWHSSVSHQLQSIQFNRVDRCPAVARAVRMSPVLRQSGTPNARSASMSCYKSLRRIVPPFHDRGHGLSEQHRDQCIQACKSSSMVCPAEY